MAAEPSALLAALDSQFLLDKARLEKIRAGFLEEEIRGLTTDSGTIAAMIPSYVNSLPTGDEVGTFLSLDLGGTNCRVAAVQLLGRGKVEVLEAKRPVLDELRVGAVATLFDWIADLVAELVMAKGRHLFLPEELTGDKTLYLGVTWSFPVNQTEINRGTVLPMGKGFTFDINGRDLAELFHNAFDRKKLNVRVSAILNDTVGTLVAHAYQNPHTSIGVIVATGTNAAYIEKIENIVKLRQEYRDSHRGGFMIINTEMDIFGSPDYLPLTEYDLQLVANSAQPDFQYYEKMMSGMYLGELTRLVMLDFIGQACLFDGVIPGGLEVPYSFQTIHMGAIESDSTAGHSKTIDFFTDTYNFAKKPSEQDVKTIHHIVKTISTRSAYLTAAATSSMIEKQDLHQPSSTKPIVIGINGSVYEHYPLYEDRVVEGLRMLYPERVHERIKVELARDGGTVGAALVAMLCAGRT